MNEKKLTDEEIVKALKNASTGYGAGIVGDLWDLTLYLINRQKAVIERLTEEIKTTNGMTAKQVIESEKLKTSIAEAVNSIVRLETLYKVKCKELEIANKKLEELNGGKVD